MSTTTGGNGFLPNRMAGNVNHDPRDEMGEDRLFDEEDSAARPSRVLYNSPTWDGEEVRTEVEGPSTSSLQTHVLTGWELRPATHPQWVMFRQPPSDDRGKRKLQSLSC